MPECGPEPEPEPCSISDDWIAAISAFLLSRLGEEGPLQPPSPPSSPHSLLSHWERSTTHFHLPEKRHFPAPLDIDRNPRSLHPQMQSPAERNLSLPPANPGSVNQEISCRLTKDSYAEALRSTSPRVAKKSLDDVGEDYKRATTYNNKPAIIYTEEEVSGMSDPFGFALIGKFSGARPNKATIIQSFAKMGLSSVYNIRFLRFGHVFIHLSSTEDMARIWTRGIRYIGGAPMRIFKWSPKFTYEAESSVVPVWIQLPDLPIYMFCKKGLFAVANIVGRPLKIDEATADGSRLTLARVCVEIDLLKPKIEDFWIGVGDDRRLQKVIYERQPKYCLHCLHLGHSVEECYGNGYQSKPDERLGKQTSQVREDLRDLKEDKHLLDTPLEVTEDLSGVPKGLPTKFGVGKQTWIPKEKNGLAPEVVSVGDAVAESFSQNVENVGESMLDLQIIDNRDKGKDAAGIQKMFLEEKKDKAQGARRFHEHIAEPTSDLIFSSGEEEDAGSLNISKSFVDMEELDSLVIRRSSSSLKDEPNDRQGSDWDPGIHMMVTRLKAQKVRASTSADF